jgi:hypothetical protein
MAAGVRTLLLLGVAGLAVCSPVCAGAQALVSAEAESESSTSSSTSADIRPAAAAFTVSTPPGFEDLVQPAPVVVDVYFGGKLIGTTSGIQEPGHFTFDEPDKVVALLPQVLDPQAVIAALTGRLEGNGALACGSQPRAGCGVLSPPVAGIIHDAGSFRLEIFIAPAYLAVAKIEEREYLPIPDAGLSLISSFAGSVGGVEGRSTDYTIQNRSILAWRNARVVADVAQSSNFGFQSQILAAELDTGSLRYRGGLMFSEPLAFTGQARIYGASVATQYDTRADAERDFTQPIALFLPRRAQINAYRDGLLIGSMQLDAGNQLLDTSAFPAGAYNITLEIVDDTGASRTETRFFTKDRSLPPVGRTAFSATAGTLAMERGGGVPEFGDDLFVQGTVGHRLSPNVSLEGGALMIGSDFVAEGGASYLADGFTARLVGLAGTDANYGLIANFSWFDLSNVSVNGFFRRTWGPGLGGLSNRDRFGITPVNDINLLVGDSTQAGGNIGVRLGKVNLRFDGLYFKSPGSDAFYAYGPSFDYATRPARNLQLTLFGDGRRSSEGWDVRVGIRINFLRDNFVVLGESGAAWRQRGGVEDSGVAGNVLATYSRPGVLRGDLSLAAGYARDLDSERVRAEANLDSQYGRFLGQVEHVFDVPDGGGTRYAANFATSLAVGGSDATIGGREIGESGIVVALKGGGDGVEMDVLVDNTPRARIRPGQSIPIFLPPYRAYSVRLAPVSGRGGRFDANAREVSLYRGNMQYLEWEVRAVQPVYGRLVDTAGRPLGGAVLYGERDFMQSDASGYFQGEIAGTESFALRKGGAELCRVTLAPAAGETPILDLGDVVCTTTPASSTEKP